jgi:3-dehydroquinate synthase
MALDKKVLSGKLRLILLKQLGLAVISRDVDVALLEQTIVACQHTVELAG